MALPATIHPSAQWAVGVGEGVPTDCPPPLLAPPSPYTSMGARRQRARTRCGIARRHSACCDDRPIITCVAPVRVAAGSSNDGSRGHFWVVLHRTNGVLPRGRGRAGARARRSGQKRGAGSGRRRPDLPASSDAERCRVGFAHFGQIDGTTPTRRLWGICILDGCTQTHNHNLI